MAAMDIKEIMGYLAHRPPFLFVDKVIECTPGKHIKAIKNVTISEPFFQGHFPGYPVMPGVLIIEALAQVSITRGSSARYFPATSSCSRRPSFVWSAESASSRCGRASVKCWSPRRSCLPRCATSDLGPVNAICLHA